MKGKDGTTEKFYRTNLVTCSHSTEGKTPSYRQIIQYSSLEPPHFGSLSEESQFTIFTLIKDGGSPRNDTAP